MKLDTPIAFLATDKPELSKRFYGDVLGLEFVADEPFALVYRCGPIILRIQKMHGMTPAAHTVYGWQVADIRKTIGALKAKRVVFEIYPQLEQDDAGIWESPGGAKVAWFRDPVGNLLSLTEG